MTGPDIGSSRSLGGKMQAETLGIHHNIQWAHLLHKMKSGVLYDLLQTLPRAHQLHCPAAPADWLTCKDVGIFHLRACFKHAWHVLYLFNKNIP